MRLAIFNVKFSPNLGDGLLSECLEAELRTYPGVDAVSLDLAGRSEYRPGSSGRRLALTILTNSPRPVRHALVRSALGYQLANAIRPRWRDILRSVDAVIVGGGNLLSDQDLNFPLKISAALDEARSGALPVAVFGVGVSDNWSRPGKNLFIRALTGSRLIHAAVRDARSQNLWRAHLVAHGIMGCETCRDPAVLAARYFPRATRIGGNTRVAIGITDPLALRYHATPGSGDEARLGSWYADLVEQLAARNWHIELFTNGSPEDRAYMARLAPTLIAKAPAQVTVAPSFGRPADLATFISGADLVLAHRLHACIAAFAFKVPHIGFAWDPKLKGFFESVGRGDYVLDPGTCKVTDAIACAATAMKSGIDSSVHARILDLARQDIAHLHERLARAVGQRAPTIEAAQDA